MNQAQQGLEEILSLAPVVPVMVIEELAHAVPLARALAKGGLKALEITLRTPVALDCIRAIAAEVPEAVVGAGTVTSPAQMEEVKKAGARFAVSPGATSVLLDAARATGMAWLPGAVTASEVMALRGEGLRFMKFFPAVPAGGVPYVAGLASVFPDVKLCPTGGIGKDNAADFLALANVICVGGSWVAPTALVKAGRFGEITALAAEASAIRAP